MPISFTAPGFEFPKTDPDATTCRAEITALAAKFSKPGLENPEVGFGKSRLSPEKTKSGAEKRKKPQNAGFFLLLPQI